MPSNYYNHGKCPSPNARIIAIKLKLDVLSQYPFTRMKRLTHAQALELLRKKAGKPTVEEFLAMPLTQSWIALGCINNVGWSRGTPYDPMHGPRKYW